MCGTTLKTVKCIIHSDGVRAQRACEPANYELVRASSSLTGPTAPVSMRLCSAKEQRKTSLALSTAPCSSTYGPTWSYQRRSVQSGTPSSPPADDLPMSSSDRVTGPTPSRSRSPSVSSPGSRALASCWLAEPACWRSTSPTAPTQDLDLLTRTAADVPAVRDAFEASARSRGWVVTRIQDGDTFCRLTVTADDALLIDLALDSPPQLPPTMTFVGPSFAPEELAARKVLAPFDRAEARDFADDYQLSKTFQPALLLARARPDREFAVQADGRP